MKDKLIISGQNGFSAIEILVAMAVMITALAAAVLVLFGIQAAAVGSETRTEALQKAQAMMEEARAGAAEDFNGLAAIKDSKDGIFTKRLDVRTLADVRTKQVTGTVSWQNAVNEEQTVSLETLATDWADPAGSTCESGLSGDWTKPAVLNTGFLINLDSASRLTDIDVNNRLAYLAANAAAKSKNDFYTVDIGSPSRPVILAGLNTGPGLSAVYAAGKFAYLANTSLNAQLQIVDISQPASPKLLGAAPNYGYKLPGAYKDDSTVGNSIFYYRGRVYLGTQKSQIEEFHIINVADPNNPFEEGKWEVGSAVNKIYVENNYAYLATPNDSEVIVLDVSSPASPRQVSQAVLPDSASHGKSLALAKGNLYLGRTRGLPAGTRELYVFDAANPFASPLPVLASQKINDSINGLVFRSGLAFLAMNYQFQIWSLADLKAIGQVAGLALPSPAAAMDCEGNLIYLGTSGSNGDASRDVLKIIGPAL